MRKVLFINGIKDSGIVTVYKILDNNTLQYINDGSCNVFNMLNEDSINSSLLTLDANQSQEVSLNDTSLIFNQISDPDTHRVSLNKADAICKKVNGNISCINRPEKILHSPRDRLPALLKDISGIITPETIRFSPDSKSQVVEKIESMACSYPVLIRRCGDHNARSLVRIENAEQTNELDPVYFESECYLTEFIDFSDENGVFEKYRFVVVRGEVFLRHVMYGDHWEIHSQVRKNFMVENPSYFEQEKEIFLTYENNLKTKIQKTVYEIYEALELEYFGIDCAINNKGELIIFEANANMNMLLNPYPKPNVWQPQVDAIRDALVAMIKSYS